MIRNGDVELKGREEEIRFLKMEVRLLTLLIITFHRFFYVIRERKKYDHRRCIHVNTPLLSVSGSFLLSFLLAHSF